MQRFVSGPLAIPPAGYVSADLEFEELDHSGASFIALIYLDQPDADAETPRDDAHGFAGQFSVFAHGDCWGDAGHCDVTEPTSPFDRRPPHPLTPINITVSITDALRRVEGNGETRVTVVAIPIGREAEEPLSFSALTLVGYE